MNPTTDRQRLEFKIAFLQQQLDSLDHYLPETYQPDGRDGLSAGPPEAFTGAGALCRY
jgi:hypothetical protein